MSDLIISLTDSSFTDFINQATTPVLVDFWGPGCPPCAALAPVLERVAEQYRGQLSIVKVNVAENAELAQRYQIRGIPTCVLICSGQTHSTIAGLQPDALKAAIEQVITH